MATATVARSYHATLTAATADTITFSQNIRNVEVKNRSTSFDIYFRVDGTAAVSAAANTLIVLPGESLIFPMTSSTDAVSIISSGAAAYSLTAVND